MEYIIKYGNNNKHPNTIMDIILECQDDKCIYQIYVNSWAPLKKIFNLKFKIKYKNNKSDSIIKITSYGKSNWQNIPKNKRQIANKMLEQFELIFNLLNIEDGQFQSFKIFKNF